MRGGVRSPHLRGNDCSRCPLRPGPPPARQHAPAGRAAQLTGRQPALDSIDICFYGDHSASEYEQTALP